MKKKILAILSFSFLSPFLWAQCPTAGFNTSGSVCPGQTVTINNTTLNATSYEWDFCAGDFSSAPVGADNTTNTPTPLAMPVVFDGTDWYGFLTNNTTATITRFDFGPTLDNNNPSSVVLTIPGGFLFAPLQNNLSFIQEGGNWYGVIANFSADNVVVKLDFGASLSNASPTPSIITLQFQSVCLFQTMVIDSGNIYMFFCNIANNNLVVSSFGNSINNVPVNSIITIPGVTNLSEIAIVKQCNNWYGILACYNGSIMKLDFGTSISNGSPVISNLNIPGLANPASVVVDNDGEGWYGFVQNDNGGILKLSFGADINNAPVTTNLSLPGVAGIGKKLSIASEQSNHFLFGTSYFANRFAKIKFARPCSASTPVSSLVTPVVSYTSGGTYYIGLKATDANGNTDFHFDSVTINDAPVPNFTYVNTALGDTTFFTDSSTVSNGTIVSWLWDFGDLTTDTLQNPGHLYTTAGQDTVTLTATSSNGCTGTKKIVITIIPSPVANFSAPDTVCAGQVVNVNNTSSNTVTYEWDFCAGDFSSVPTAADDPTFTLAPLSMTPVFDGINWYGFVTNSSTATITRFDFGPSLANNSPASVILTIPGGYLNASLQNNMSFIKEGATWYGLIANFSLDNTLVKLDFGGSLSNNSPAPSIITLQYQNLSLFQTMVIDSGNIYMFFCNIGNNNLVVSNFGNSINNTPVTSAIPVTGVTQLSDIAFAKIRNHWYGIMSCYSGSIVKLDFGPSLSNTSPLITILNVPGLVNPASIVIDNDGEGWYGFVQNDNAGILKLSFGNDINNAPTTTTLTLGSVFGVGKKLTIANDASSHYLFGTSYNDNRWAKINFSRPCSASTPLSSSAVPSVAYNANGMYYIGLKAFDANGNAAFHFDSIAVKIAAIANFSFANRCLGDITVFADSTTIVSPGTIVSRLWDFGDFSTDTVPSPTHLYSAAGTYMASLTTTASTGCVNTKTVAVNITPKPVANFSAPPGCSEDSVHFIDLSTIASGSITGWSWQFGNTDISTLTNPVYAYSTGGNYLVLLQVTSDSGCTDTASTLLNIAYRPQADFDVSNTCIGQNVQFIDQTTSQSSIQSYHWDFGTGDTSSMSSPTYLYPVSVATYPVSFAVQAANGCTDTVTRLIKINNIPVANFSYSPSTVCEGNNTTFTDLSTVSGDTISGWYWDFGDTHTDSSQNPVHQYATQGNYTVTLIAYSPTSCGNSISQNISVIQSPTAMFVYTDVCFGNPTQFTNQSTTPTGSTIDSLFWDFGDSYTDTVPNPSHTFLTSGTHLVTLTVKSNFGCLNAIQIPVVVHPIPVASFVNTNPCTVDSVLFNSTSVIDTPSFITNYLWNFGNPVTGTFNTSTLQNPSHLFDTTGIFVVSLITTSDFGCMDTAFSVLNVKPAARAAFQYAPTCVGNLVQFTRLPPNNPLDSAWFWAFGDGQFGPLESPTHYYAIPTTYDVTLTVYSFSGCVSSITKQVTVSPKPVAAFVYSAACIGSPTHFTDSSHVTTGSIIGWNWNFAGLDSSTLQNPVFTFPDTGTYIVKLTVTSDIGCINTDSIAVVVHPLPIANFSFNPPFGNPPLNVTFTNLTIGGSTYEWNFGDDTTTNTSIHPQHLYTDTNLYSIQLIATSQFGCKDTIVKSIYVIRPVLDLAITDVSSIVDNNHLQITVELANLGTRSIYDFILEARLENGTAVQESYIQTLPNGYAGQQVFFSKLDLGSGQARYYCVRAVKPNGTTDDVPSNNELCKSLTKEFSIINPYPNPFNDQLVLQLILPYKDQVSIELFDMIGKKKTLFEGEGKEGLNQFETDLGDLANGTYAVRFTFRESEVIKTIVKVERKK